MDRLARDALTAFNDAVARHHGRPIAGWPPAPASTSPVEVAWAAQPFAFDVHIRGGALWWRHADGRFTQWTMPMHLWHFVADWDAGKYPELRYELPF